MPRVAAPLIALLLATCGSQQAFAVPIQITVQGNLTKGEFDGSFFGITDPTVPVQVSFLVEDADAVTLAAGTAVITQSGAGFNSDAHLFSGASVTNFTATIGSMSFTAADLYTQGLGTSGYSFGVLLLGSLSENGLSTVQFDLRNSFGAIQFGTINCSSLACSLLNYGYGESWLEGSVAEISSIQAFAQVQPSDPPTSVPEPSTLALFAAGFGAIFLFRRRALLGSAGSATMNAV